MNQDKASEVETLLEKGVSEIFPNREFLQKLLTSDKRLTIYAGFDPTAPTLHLGHTIQLRKLRQFQDLGHQVIFLIGDFTAMIGDPTDKLAARTQLTPGEIKQNLKKYKKQAAALLRFSGKNKAIVKFNSTWLGKMRFKDILSLASLMTVDQLLKRDMFDRRMKEEKPIYLHEFLYPLMQGYDSVALQVDGEVGGSDQTFNMLTGRTLEVRILQKEKFVLTLKLLEDGTGKKMGKSEGNMVSLDESPEQMYGKIMSWPDSVIPSALELLTDISLKEIKAFLQNTPHPKEQKMKLAFETVKALRGEQEAFQAQNAFVHTFQKGEIPLSIKTYKQEPVALEDFLVHHGIVKSKSEVRRLATGGAIYKLDPDTKIEGEQIKAPVCVGAYRIGKTTFFKIV